jgi:hypothetical protein
MPSINCRVYVDRTDTKSLIFFGELQIMSGNNSWLVVYCYPNILQEGLKNTAEFAEGNLCRNENRYEDEHRLKSWLPSKLVSV